MTVKVFRSTDYDAPANTNAAGALIAILDACLVNGYGSQTATITSAAGVATVTTPVAHTLKDDTFIRISGAMQADYNGDFPITITGANTFTYAVANSPASPATGTIASKVAPANWTKPFSGTNLAAYKQGAGSNGMYLRVDDILASYNAFPKVRAYETMTDVNTGTGDFPTVAQTTAMGSLFGLHKSQNSTVQAWVIIATEKGAFIWTGVSASTNGDFHYFGDFVSNKSGDAFNTLFLMGFQASYDNHIQDALSAAYSPALTGHYLPRNHTQIGTSISCGKMSPTGQSYMGHISNAIPAYPSAIDNALHISPVYVTESAGIRGKIPGLWNIKHAAPFQNGDIITGTGDALGKKFMAITTNSGNGSQCLLEISNTW